MSKTEVSQTRINLCPETKVSVQINDSWRNQADGFYCDSPLETAHPVFPRDFALNSANPDTLRAACETLAHSLLVGDKPHAANPGERLAESILSFVLFESIQRQQRKEVDFHDDRNGQS